jgi:flagellar biosynthesis protein
MRRIHKPIRKTDRAVALRYDEATATAPVVIAKGEGLIASRIKEIAQSEGIPLHRDDDLVELLSELEIERDIPPELFAAVAEILAFVYKGNSIVAKEFEHA